MNTIIFRGNVLTLCVKSEITVSVHEEELCHHLAAEKHGRRCFLHKSFTFRHCDGIQLKTGWPTRYAYG